MTYISLGSYQDLTYPLGAIRGPIYPFGAIRGPIGATRSYIYLGSYQDIYMHWELSDDL